MHIVHTSSILPYTSWLAPTFLHFGDQISLTMTWSTPPEHSYAAPLDHRVFPPGCAFRTPLYQLCNGHCHETPVFWLVRAHAKLTIQSLIHNYKSKVFFRCILSYVHCPALSTILIIILMARCSGITLCMMWWKPTDYDVQRQLKPLDFMHQNEGNAFVSQTSLDLHVYTFMSTSGWKVCATT